MAKQFSASAVSMGISAFATNWSGSTASSVTLLGSTQAVNAVNQDLSGAALSLNLDSIKIAGGDFSVHTKTSFDSDGGVGTSITARFQMSF
jgi:hypothetical protein